MLWVTFAIENKNCASFSLHPILMAELAAHINLIEEHLNSVLEEGPSHRVLCTIMDVAEEATLALNKDLAKLESFQESRREELKFLLVNQHIARLCNDMCSTLLSCFRILRDTK